MVRCLRCPVAYHSGDGCIAAGSLFVSSHILICSNHSKRNLSSSAVNVGFCFVCARGEQYFFPPFSLYVWCGHYYSYMIKLGYFTQLFFSLGALCSLQIFLFDCWDSTHDINLFFMQEFSRTVLFGVFGVQTQF